MVQFIEKHYIKIIIILPLISFIMHFHVFRLELIGVHVWRQTQTQTVINNFCKEDFNILHPKFNDKADTDRIVRMEFPVMQWLFAIPAKVFGHEVLISRLMTFIIGIFSIFSIFVLLRNLFKNNVIATIGAWTFAFSPVFFYYTVNPLPDNLSLCCAIWTLAFFIKWNTDRKSSSLIFSALFFTLSVLAKMPFIIYAGFIGTYLILLLKRKKIELKTLFLAFSIYFIVLVPALIWYLIAIPTWKGNGIVNGILDSALNWEEIFYILQHNLISTLPELLINYASFPFFIAGFYFIFKRKTFKNPYFPAFIIWSAAVLLYFFFELNMITTVHDYYLFPFLPLIFIIIAYGAYNLLAERKKTLKYIVASLLIIAPVTSFLRANPRWDTKKPGFNVDFLIYKNELRAIAEEQDKVVVGKDISHFILLYYVDKKGWTYDNYFVPEMLEKWIENGAKYIYIDNQIDTINSVKNHLDQKVFDKGTIRVYKLKSVNQEKQ